ncbi:putative coiled-coil domain-containing protein 42B [Scophthalmus maximus]|uniref:Putative coiled-coil domain-containing protein 42B n=1 Tax=Scophthalmus maximus TaxID=52904 RepID=A0A2U9D0L2_SCOMX|nr:putative coiled-coil domain-containing protein 42B [Scophthalmus maximus]
MSLPKPIEKKQKLDKSVAVMELPGTPGDDEQLKAGIQERKQELKSLTENIDELQMHYQKAQEINLSFHMFLKEEEAEKAVEDAERERTEVLEMDTQIEILKEEKAELLEKKRGLDDQVQSQTVYPNIMEQMAKVTPVKDAETLADKLENKLKLRDQLCEREKETEEQIEQQRKALEALKGQHDMLRLQKNNQLSQLHIMLNEMHSEALFWQRKWDHVQETTAKKKLLLAQIKMTTLNLYESTGGNLEEDGIQINNTDQQLDRIKIFIQDHDNIVKAHWGK